MAAHPCTTLCRQHGISSATFYKWRSKFGGMDASMVSQLNELRDENRRLKNTYAEAQLSADLLKGALKEMVRPSQRRETAKRAVQAIAHACQTFGVRPACYRYQAKASQENAIIVDWLVRLPSAYQIGDLACASRTCAT